MKLFKKTIPYIYSLLNIYFLFVLSFYTILYSDKNFLLKLFYKFNVRENLPFNISDSDLSKISYELMSYLRGHSLYLDTKISIDNSIKELYSLTAKIHMADVRNIFLANIHLAVYVFIISSLIIIIYSYKNKLDEILKAYIKTFLSIFILLFIIIIYASTNFSSFFMLFHKLVFTNEYYLFNPNVDYIILMLPEELFAHIGLKVSILFIILIILFTVFLYFASKIQSRLEAK